MKKSIVLIIPVFFLAQNVYAIEIVQKPSFRAKVAAQMHKKAAKSAAAFSKFNETHQIAKVPGASQAQPPVGLTSSTTLNQAAPNPQTQRSSTSPATTQALQK